MFSDGTGQAGGILVDEHRSNVYKLFRATRCGPDSEIDPDKQLAFYDPGLGSASAGEDIKVGFLRKIYNGLSSATGLGITKNIIDCYAALIHLWRPGDRIFLFGFSRGAYTVRCLGGVLGLCGIPTRLPNGRPLLRDPDTVRAIAREAVVRVYRHGSGADDRVRAAAKADKGQQREKQEAVERKGRLHEQRQALGRQFRDRYHSSGQHGANVVPYFIGVWDTVAAVGIAPPAAAIMKWISWAGLLIAAAGIAWWAVGQISLSFLLWFVAAAAGLVALVSVMYFGLRVKFVTGLPGYKWYETLHLISFKMAFFDRSLNPNVRYARHALAIDEYRADFDRVPWENHGAPPERELGEGEWFEQIWFAGNHSDVGGSYPENESRLSDLALEWMVEEAKKAGLLVDERYLRLYGRHTGQQHDECRAELSFLGLKLRWRKHTRKIARNATLHPSVLRRFHEPSVLIYDEEMPYRPSSLADHKELREVYLQEAIAAQAIGGAKQAERAA
ncbi:MAG TPA: DUF2235 domain-containing protein [Microvirga sp.]|nr:DUF2235 domain-containing protein [Microvirga sp.]